MPSLREVLVSYRRHSMLTAALNRFGGELSSELARMFLARELRLVALKSDICAKFYAYHAANPDVADLFLTAARTLRDRNRQRYGISALTEEVRWGNKAEIQRTDAFKISNDHRACYARLVLMRDESLCGFLSLRPSAADALVIDGVSWASFAIKHAAELSAGHITKRVIVKAIRKGPHRVENTPIRKRRAR